MQQEGARPGGPPGYLKIVYTIILHLNIHTCNYLQRILSTLSTCQILMTSHAKYKRLSCRWGTAHQRHN